MIIEKILEIYPVDDILERIEEVLKLMEEIPLVTQKIVQK